MKIKECAFISFKTLWDTPSAGTCNLLPKYYNNGLDYRFVECDILDCPYKQFKRGNIDKIELDRQIKEIMYGKKHI